MHSGIPPGTAHSGLSAIGAMRGWRATKVLAATPDTMARPDASRMVWAFASRQFST